MSLSIPFLPPKKTSLFPAAFEKGIGRFSSRGLRFDEATLEGHDFWKEAKTAAVSSFRTKGGGGCSIHALLGKPDESGVLSHPEPRAWIANVLAFYDSFDSVVAFGQGKGLCRTVEDIATTMGHDLIVPHVLGHCDAASKRKQLTLQLSARVNAAQ